MVTGMTRPGLRPHPGMEARASAAANVTRCRFGIGSSRLMGTMRRMTVGDPRRGAQINSILALVRIDASR